MAIDGGVILAESRTGYDRRYEDKVFPDGLQCIEMVDYIGTGGERDASGEMIDGGKPGNFYGVAYCNAVSFYRCFANATFGAPCRITVGEYPVDGEHGSNLEPVIGEGTQRINMAASFKNSDLQILPHGFSRYLIDNVNGMFDGCRLLKYWGPEALRAAGLCGRTEADAPKILRGNGLEQTAFFLNLKPRTMRRFMAGCVSYNGAGLNAVSWSGLEKDDSASGWATGCKFRQDYLEGIIGNMHREFFVLKTMRTPLLNVDLGQGRVTGVAARQANDLIEAGVQITGIEIA